MQILGNKNKNINSKHSTHAAIFQPDFSLCSIHEGVCENLAMVQHNNLPAVI